MLGFEPAGADPEREPAATHLIDGQTELEECSRMPVADGGDQRGQFERVGGRGEAAQVGIDVGRLRVVAVAVRIAARQVVVGERQGDKPTSFRPPGRSQEIQIAAPGLEGELHLSRDSSRIAGGGGSPGP